MEELINRIKNLSTEIADNDRIIVAKFNELRKVISDSLNGVNVSGRSDDANLQMIGPDDWYYGYLSFSNNQLKIAYRSTQKDFEDSMNEIPLEYQSFDYQELESSPIEWIHSLSKEEHIENLLLDIEEKLNLKNERTKKSIESLSKYKDPKSEIMAKDAVEAIMKEGTKELLDSWLKARRSIHSDPEDSINRSSGYLESICRLILEKTNQSLPDKKTINSLINAAINSLELSEDDTANKDLKQLFGGIKGIFQSVGSMRTHFSTAHGFSPGDFVPSEHYARLVSDASATVSTYLLWRLGHFNSSFPKDRC